MPPDFRFSRKGPIEYLEALPLTATDFLLHAFLTRHGGVSTGCFAGLNFSSREGDTPENVARNRQLLAAAFQVDPSRFISMRQVHGDRIVVLDGDDREYLAGGSSLPVEAHVCDALVTNRPGRALGVKTADCVPIFLVDPVKRVVGVVHAGWRGTALNIAGQVVDTFAARFSSRPGDILATIGPAIGPCCYEVDATVYKALNVYAKAGEEPLFRSGTAKGRWMLDLTMANRYQLEQRGVPATRIFTGNHCTSCRSDVFYSHRRDQGRTGRHFSFLMLKD